jgi:hypothetical protein
LLKDLSTSAYITRTNEVVQAASIEASPAWKAFYLDTLRVKRSFGYVESIGLENTTDGETSEQQKHAKEKDVEELISSTLSEVRKATEKYLGRPVEINSISYPEHFKGVPYVEAIAWTAIKVYPEIIDVMQVSPYLNCVRLAYGLNTAEALRYPPGTDIEETNNLLLHFDYQNEFLEVSIMDVTVDVDLRVRFFRIDGFGGSERRVSVRSCIRPSLYRPNISQPEDLADLKTRFQALLDEQIADNKYSQTQPEDFRFIIFSGEGAPPEFLKISQVIAEVAPEIASRIRLSIDPFWVGAVGAARRAKEFAIKQPVTHIDYQMADGVDPNVYGGHSLRDQSHEHGHNEL